MFWSCAPGKSSILVLRWFLIFLVLIFDHSFKGAYAGCCLLAWLCLALLGFALLGFAWLCLALLGFAWPCLLACLLAYLLTCLPTHIVAVYFSRHFFSGIQSKGFEMNLIKNWYENIDGTLPKGKHLLHSRSEGFSGSSSRWTDCCLWRHVWRESENDVSRRFPKGINEIFEWQTGSVPTVFCVTDTEPQAKNIFLFWHGTCQCQT